MRQFDRSNGNKKIEISKSLTRSNILNIPITIKGNRKIIHNRKMNQNIITSTNAQELPFVIAQLKTGSTSQIRLNKIEKMFILSTVQTILLKSKENSN